MVWIKYHNLTNCVTLLLSSTDLNDKYTYMYTDIIKYC